VTEGVADFDPRPVLEPAGGANQPVSSSSRVWFVTGASSGFGRAICSAVVERGDRLAATAREPEALRDLAAGHPDQVVALRLDVTDPGAARQAVAEAVARFGRIDVVINNAGYGHIGAVEELSDEEVRQQLETNLFGVIHVTRAVLPVLRRQRRGHLVQMSSLNGVEGLPGGAIYVASKFAVEGFSESLADEVAHLGIRVTIVEPGPHRTRFLNPRSDRSSEPIDDYADSVGQVRTGLAELDGQQPGDPDRAARAIIQVVEAAEPPRRLPLGEMALERIRAKLQGQLEELEAWAELSASSDFPPEPVDGAGARP
jgi:NAD(P)-dependent dehydrogenase (short-subunit alcohol dehydrogenase family)